MIERNKKLTGKKGGKRTAAPTPKPNTRKESAGSQKAGRSNAVPGRRRYSDEERGASLAVLDANGGNLLRTSEQLGIPRKTLEGWAKDRANPAVAQIRLDKKAELAKDFEEIALTLLKLAKANLHELTPSQQMMNAAIATDKWLLLNDMPNGIQKVTGFEDLPDDELDRLLTHD